MSHKVDDPISERSGAGHRAVTITAIVFLLASLVAVALALVGRWGDWSALESGARSWQPRPMWLTISVLSGAGGLLVSGAVWTRLFRVAGGQIGWWEGIAAWIGSNLGRYLPGKIWQVTGLAGYVRARGGSGATALATLLVFQAIMVATGGAVGLAVLGRSAFEGAGGWGVALAVVGLGVTLHPRFLGALVGFGRRLLREPESQAVVPVGTADLVWTAGGGLIVWTLHGVGFWALLQGLVAGPTVSLLLAIGIFGASYVLGYLVLVAPGGMVVREGAIAGFLSALIGIPLAPAAALALAARVGSTVAEIVAFLLAAGVGLRRDRDDR